MKTLWRILLVLCLPAFLLSPVPSTAFSPQQHLVPCFDSAGRVIEIPRDEFGRVNPWILFLPENLSLDRYFQFIELTEDEAFLESLTEEEFDIVVDFVTKIVRSSAPEGRPDLQEEYEHAIDELMEDLYGEAKLSFSFESNSDFKVTPAVCFQNAEFILCKGWLKRKVHHFGHWCSKHKKPLIIGAVVVGVVTVAVVTGGVGGSSAAAVGGGLISGLDGESDKHINKPGEVYVDDGEYYPPSSNSATQNGIAPEHSSPGDLGIFKDTRSSSNQHLHQAHSTELQSENAEEYAAFLVEQADPIKTELFEQFPNEALNIVPQEEPSLWNQVIEKGRELTSQFAHGVYGLITDQLEPVVEIEGVATDLLENVSTNLSDISPFEENPRDVFKEQVAQGHQKIDEVFHTDYASLYSDEARAAEAEITTGILPFPGAGIGKPKTSSKFFERSLKHIFRDKPGHLPDTPANRQLLLEISGDSKNFLGTDKYGKTWHAKTQKDGTQVWTCSRNGEIRNGGLNKAPKNFDRETGLSSPERPK